MKHRNRTKEKVAMQISKIFAVLSNSSFLRRGKRSKEITDSPSPKPRAFYFQLLLDFSRKNWVVAVGVLAAALAFWSTQQYADERVQAERARLMPSGGMVEILVASRDLFVNEKLSAETLAIRRLPSQWALPNTVGPIDFDSVNQRVLSRPLHSGHPLTLDHVQRPGAEQENVQIEWGHRAIAIPADEVSTAGGLVQPGDRVDLWVPISRLDEIGQSSDSVGLAPEQQIAPRLARLVAENLRVIATGAKTSRQTEAMAARESASPYTSLTLAVPASKTHAVLGAMSQGRISVALRAPPEVLRPPTKQTAEVNSSLRKRDHSPPADEDLKKLLAPVEILLGGAERVNQ